MKNSLSCLLLLCGAVLLARFGTSLSADESTFIGPEPSPEFTELRTQLTNLERSNKEVVQKWEALAHQNSALSNVLSGLQQTLESQRRREVEIGDDAHSFSLLIVLGAAGAVVVILILSYWFQLRCLNRVIELSSAPATHPFSPPALPEGSSAQTSALLAAIKGLENRIDQLEFPSDGGEVKSAFTPTESGSVRPGKFIANDVTSTNGSSNVSLLLAKGQTFLEIDRLQDALGCFQEALIHNPDNAEAHFKKGLALERMNRLEPALSAYDESLRLNPKRSIAHAYKARVLTALHRYDEAISVYDSALGKNATATGTPIFSS